MNKRRRSHTPAFAVNGPIERLQCRTTRSKRGKADRRRVAANEGYEVNYFAHYREQARNLIKKIGTNRDKFNAAAANL